ncbi:NUDIX hydrolase [Candidatus Woesearchaeota archaeon]|nr:NUDIX hydrolase [Candidatus Woesearchaeota archaeon]
MKKVAVGIISRKNEAGEKEYLLVSSKKKFGEYTGFYYPPGGHVEADEDIEEALSREINEEVNLEVISCQKIAETEGDVKDQITYWYICKVKSYDITYDRSELADANYFTRKKILSMNVWPATMKVFEDYVFKR